MKELETYIEMCLNQCKRSATGKGKEIHFAHAFGAMDMYVLLHPEQEKELHNLWNSKWYPDFIEEIWGYRP